MNNTDAVPSFAVSVPVAVMTVDRQGRVLHATRLARRWLEDHDAVDPSSTGIVSSSPVGDALLSAIRRGSQPGTSIDMVEEHVLIRLAPPSGSEGDDALGHLRDVMVVRVSGASVRRSALREAAEQQFGATAAESVVAALIVEGHSVEDVARRLGRSRETVRTHVKRLLHKCGVRKRRDLDDCLSAAAGLALDEGG